MDPLDVPGLVGGAGSERETVTRAGLRCKRDELLAFEEMSPELVISGVEGEARLGINVVVCNLIC